MKLSLLYACCLCLVVVASARAAEFRVPLFTKPPLIDGKINATEWANAAGLDGFVTGDTLERRRVHAWVGADADNIYVAIQSQTPGRRGTGRDRHDRFLEGGGR